MARIFWPTLAQLRQTAAELGIPNPDSLHRKELLQAIIRIKKAQVKQS
ncbi:MAG: hypothetical protein HC924_13470 [Synechococcaceae cyanobacterium SM2_3_2]|nr:hypothetical protein [Synechococcaceae cyanobacterium SM2_3_2]